MIVLCDGSSLGLLCGEWVVGGMPGSGETSRKLMIPVQMRESGVCEPGTC